MMSSLLMTKMFSSFKKLSSEERMEMVNCYIGNTARTYIMTRIVLKHLYRISIEVEDFYSDIYWQERIRNVKSNIEE